MGDQKKKKARNLTKDEIKKVVLVYIKMLKNIKINNKPLIVNSRGNSFTSNPEISIEELQEFLKISDKTKLDFFRQMYVKSGYTIIKKLFPNEEIANLPVISFQENGAAITLNY